WLYWRSTMTSSFIIRYSSISTLENSTTISTIHRVRAKKLCGNQSGVFINRKPTGAPYIGFSTLVAIGHEHIADAPDRLDIARLGRVGLDQTAQARDLHVDGALQRIPFAATGQVHQLVAGQGFAGMLHQRL